MYYEVYIQLFGKIKTLSLLNINKCVHSVSYKHYKKPKQITNIKYNKEKRNRI